MSVFDKCPRFTEAQEAEARGVYPYFHPITETRGTEVRMRGAWRLMAGSNDYLGLAEHPAVLEAAAAALRRLGSGCTGSRLMNGTLDLHRELEEELADFLGKPDAMVFPTGYQANLGTVSALVGRRDHVILDRANHACIVDGARLGLGKVHRYDHADLSSLSAQLDSVPDGSDAMIVTDGVFSMDGDIAPLPGIVALARPRGAAVVIDDAHALGVLGENGAGTAEHFGLGDAVDLVIVTFSKSLASVGGAVAGAADVLHYLRHRARPFVFSAALPPASTAGALEALRIARAEPERRDRLWTVTRALIGALRAEGFDLGRTETPVVPVKVGEYATVIAFWRALFDAGVFVNAVVPPGVPAGGARLRVTLSAAHSDDDVARIVDAFVSVRAGLGEASASALSRD